MDKSIRKNGNVLTNKEYQKEKHVACENKLVFIEGLIDAYNKAYDITHNKRFLLPYKVGDYKSELDAICEKPENRNKTIAEIILSVNKKLKRSGE